MLSPVSSNALLALANRTSGIFKTKIFKKKTEQINTRKKGAKMHARGNCAGVKVTTRENRMELTAHSVKAAQ